MLSLNVPFVPNDEYLGFLLENEAHIQTLHYSLYDPGLQDARIHLEDIPVKKLIDSLKQLKKTKKYVLAYEPLFWVCIAEQRLAMVTSCGVTEQMVISW